MASPRPIQPQVPTIYHCPRCGRSDITIVCECKHPLEDEWILCLLNFLVEDVKLRPQKADESTDATCVAITSYMRGREQNLRR
jgi:hypothetical protein